MQNLVRIVGVLLIIGASAWWYAGGTAGFHQDEPRRGGGGGGGGRNRARLAGPVLVATAPVGKQDVPVYVEGIGTVQGFNTVTVKARVDGQLDEVTFVEGQEVKEGDVLARIDPRQYEARLSQAKSVKARNEAQLANVQLDLARAVKLGQFATQQTVDTQRALVRQLEASLQSDQATIDQAALELGYATIRAPISGRTGVRLVDKGNVVRAGDATGIVVITQMQPITVSFALPQQHLHAINEALSKGEVQVAALDPDGKTIWEHGVLAVVDNRIDPQTGTIRLKATFPNASRKLWPGQFVNARVQLDVRKDSVVVPAAVVQRNSAGAFAYVVDANRKAEMRTIRVGQVIDGVALIEAGLESGERVVVTSQELLRPGATVIASAEPLPTVASPGPSAPTASPPPGAVRPEGASPVPPTSPAAEQRGPQQRRQRP